MNNSQKFTRKYLSPLLMGIEIAALSVCLISLGIFRFIVEKEKDALIIIVAGLVSIFFSIVFFKGYHRRKLYEIRKQQEKATLANSQK